MRHFLFPAFALCFALSASAQPSDEATHRTAPPSPPAQAKIQPGELRLDGQISAILDANQRQMDVISWTSSAGQITPFDEKHSKNIRLSKSTWVHRAKS